MIAQFLTAHYTYCRPGLICWTQPLLSI